VRAIKIYHYGYSSASALKRSRCHLGRSIVYDTVKEKGWYVYVGHHPMETVISDILNSTWPPAEKVGREVPEAVAEEDCVVRHLYPRPLTHVLIPTHLIIW
jgi:putative lipase involved disintegration of autophagic bodies